MDIKSSQTLVRSKS